MAATDRTVAFQSFDHGYTGLDGLTVKAGETIEFAMTNTATDEQHEFEVLGPDGKALGEIGPTDPGATGTVVLTFARAGSYEFVCGIADHEAMGMKGQFTVTPA